MQIIYYVKSDDDTDVQVWGNGWPKYAFETVTETQFEKLIDFADSFPRFILLVDRTPNEEEETTDSEGTTT